MLAPRNNDHWRRRIINHSNMGGQFSPKRDLLHGVAVGGGVEQAAAHLSDLTDVENLVLLISPVLGTAWELPLPPRFRVSHR